MATWPAAVSNQQVQLTFTVALHIMHTSATPPRAESLLSMLYFLTTFRLFPLWLLNQSGSVNVTVALQIMHTFATPLRAEGNALIGAILSGHICMTFFSKRNPLTSDRFVKNYLWLKTLQLLFAVYTVLYVRNLFFTASKPYQQVCIN